MVSYLPAKWKKKEPVSHSPPLPYCDDTRGGLCEWDSVFTNSVTFGLSSADAGQEMQTVFQLSPSKCECFFMKITL